MALANSEESHGTGAVVDWWNFTVQTSLSDGKVYISLYIKDGLWPLKCYHVPLYFSEAGHMGGDACWIHWVNRRHHWCEL